MRQNGSFAQWRLQYWYMTSDNVQLGRRVSRLVRDFICRNFEIVPDEYRGVHLTRCPKACSQGMTFMNQYIHDWDRTSAGRLHLFGLGDKFHYRPLMHQNELHLAQISINDR